SAPLLRTGLMGSPSLRLPPPLHPPARPPFPTRRSSDLSVSAGFCRASRSRVSAVTTASWCSPSPSCTAVSCLASRRAGAPNAVRSEEHTSELQSLTNIVCRLLLEKKHIMRQRRHSRLLS